MVDDLTKTKGPITFSLTQKQIDFFKRQKQPDGNELVGKFADSLIEAEGRGAEAKSFDYDAKLAMLEARKRRIEAAAEIVVIDDHGRELRGEIDFALPHWYARGSASGEWWNQNKEHFKRADNAINPYANPYAPLNPLALEPIDIDGEIFVKKRKERAEALKQVGEDIAKLKKDYAES
jgi:hypothetical protein